MTTRRERVHHPVSPRLRSAEFAEPEEPVSYVEDGSVAISAARREEMVVVGLAVRLSIALEEVLGAQFLAAVGADEVLRMPSAPQRRHHLHGGKEFTTTALGNKSPRLQHAMNQSYRLVRRWAYRKPCSSLWSWRKSLACSCRPAITNNSAQTTRKRRRSSVIDV